MDNSNTIATGKEKSTADGFIIFLTELITKYMTDYEGKLDEAIAKLDLQSEEYQKTKEKGEALGNKLLEVFKNDLK